MSAVGPWEGLQELRDILARSDALRSALYTRGHGGEEVVAGDGERARETVRRDVGTRKEEEREGERSGDLADWPDGGRVTNAACVGVGVCVRARGSGRISRLGSSRSRLERARARCAAVGERPRERDERMPCLRIHIRLHYYTTDF